MKKNRYVYHISIRKLQNTKILRLKYYDRKTCIGTVLKTICVTLELWSCSNSRWVEPLEWTIVVISYHYICIIALVILLYRLLVAVIRLNFCSDFIVKESFVNTVRQCSFYIAFDVISDAGYSRCQKRKMTTILSHNVHFKRKSCR